MTMQKMLSSGDLYITIRHNRYNKANLQMGQILKLIKAVTKRCSKDESWATASTTPVNWTMSLMTITNLSLNIDKGTYKITLWETLMSNSKRVATKPNNCTGSLIKLKRRIGKHKVPYIRIRIELQLLCSLIASVSRDMQ